MWQTFIINCNDTISGTLEYTVVIVRIRISMSNNVFLKAHDKTLN